MRLVIDLQGAQSGSSERGIGRYSLQAAKAILNAAKGHECFVLLNGLFDASIDSIRRELAGCVPQRNFRVWTACAPLDYLDEVNSWRRRAAEIAREAFIAELEPDVVYITSMIEGYADQAVTSVRSIGFRPVVVSTYYDAIPYLNQDDYFPEHELFRNYYVEKLLQLHRADHYFAISDFSKRELCVALGIDEESCTVIGAATHLTSPVAGSLASGDVEQPASTYGKYIFYASATDKRKNHERLIRAYASLPAAMKRDHRLVLAGKTSDARRVELKRVMAESGLSANEVVILGQVSDDELIALYAGCELFVFPSWHEGFGLPVLEAMVYGRATIGAGNTAVAEVIDLPAALFDPFDVGDMARAMARALSDADFRRELKAMAARRVTAFSWQEVGARAVAAFERLVTDRSWLRVGSATQGRRPRLAFVAPLPPERTGIADYSAELIPVLSRHYDIDLIVEQDTVEHLWLSGQFRVRSANWYMSHLDAYERVLYHFGNSPFHAYMFKLLAHVSGAIVLHDFYLSGCLAALDKDSVEPGAWLRELHRSHGYPALVAKLRSDDWDEIVDRFPCSRFIFEKALGVIFHSTYSRDLAQTWYQFEGASRYIPHLRFAGSLEKRETARRSLGLADGDFLVCSFGMMAPTKLNLELVQAWARSQLGRDARCRLVFVGEPNGASYGKSVNAEIDRCPEPDRIMITGWADRTTFETYLSACDLAVQLRNQSRGETSGTILDCMSRLVPVIFNAHGSFIDLPGDIGEKLADGFSVDELARALEGMLTNVDRRVRAGQRGYERILSEHSPRRCATQYAEAIEAFYTSATNSEDEICRAIREIDAMPQGDSDQLHMAAALDFNRPAHLTPTLYIDVSSFVRTELRTGVERSVHRLLMELLPEVRRDFRVEPVYATAEAQGYRCARSFTLQMFGCATSALSDDWVTPRRGDVFLGLDLNQHLITVQAGALQGYRNAGCTVLFVVHDLLPVLLPETFPPFAEETHRKWLQCISQFDGVIGVSETVMNEMRAWRAENVAPSPLPFYYGWFHHGSNFAARDAGETVEHAKELEAIQRAGAVFLMVGTIEPRKSYLQVLDAFDLLWSQGVDATLVIVGAEGWKGLAESDRRTIPQTVRRLREHPESRRRLFWFDGPSDAVLRRCYELADALIAASEGEGFGIPLVEASAAGVPVIARDIPVFREVLRGRESSQFFAGRGGEAIAGAVKHFLAGRTAARPEDAVQPQSWRDSAAQLMDRVHHAVRLVSE